MRPPSSDTAVRCIDLSIARTARGAGDVRVIDGVSFDLPHGGAIAVMGPTGAGKSSLAAVLAGSEESGLSIVGGDAVVEGISARRPGRAHRRHTYVTGYLPQSAGRLLPARFTVAEVIGHPITSRDRHVNQRALSVRIATLLDELMLPLGTATKYPYELSAGMRQRVAFARSLVLDPRVLIADDPYANLDVDVRISARDAITRRRDRYGMATVIVTNELDAARELDAAVIVLRGGHTIAWGHTADDLLWTPSGEADRRLVGA